ncbi:hypothetical protein DL95DRAFT_188062 [Leptodontidium sp. 2 PMI_412]|nr:hypothetical protein DL95DRAFT_188062 [Leptodontidium sp. 2 PMI_412]
MEAHALGRGSPRGVCMAAHALGRGPPRGQTLDSSCVGACASSAPKERAMTSLLSSVASLLEARPSRFCSFTLQASDVFHTMLCNTMLRNSTVCSFSQRQDTSRRQATRMIGFRHSPWSQLPAASAYKLRGMILVGLGDRMDNVQLADMPHCRGRTIWRSKVWRQRGEETPRWLLKT